MISARFGAQPEGRREALQVAREPLRAHEVDRLARAEPKRLNVIDAAALATRHRLLHASSRIGSI
jgi:hypothetical protein